MTDPSQLSADTPGQPVSADVIAAARKLLGDGSQRCLLGIVGAPGAGKSTLTDVLVHQLYDQAVNVPMDGFHLAERQLARLGLTDRKGAPRTFDANGYVALLARIRHGFENGDTVYAPVFEREIGEPVAGAIAVEPATPLVITEGNYLLLEEPPWCEILHMLDEVWYLNIADDVRENWLADRHVCHGRTRTESWDWIAHNDRPNASQVTASSNRADRHLIWDGTTIRFQQPAADL